MITQYLHIGKYLQNVSSVNFGETEKKWKLESNCRLMYETRL